MLSTSPLEVHVALRSTFKSLEVTFITLTKYLQNSQESLKGHLFPHSPDSPL